MGGRKKGGRLSGGCLERTRGQNAYFHIFGCIYNLQISLSEFFSLRENQLLALSVASHAKRVNSLGWNCA